MAVYDFYYNLDFSPGPLKLIEHHIYGSSRLGIVRRDQDMDSMKVDPVNANLVGATYLYQTERGKKLYELSNHLGNVLVTISDRKLGHDDGTGNYDYYTADVVNASDYFPFGMMMLGRSDSDSSGYRYGFNRQEKSTELNDNLFTAKYWEYDSRIGRRWNIDPKPTTKISLYSTFADNPILYTDVLGDTTKFFAENGSLIYQNNKGKGTSLYAVAQEQFNSLKSKYKNGDKLTNELIKVGIVAYGTQDEAATAWAPTGFAATKDDPNHFERAARIFHAKAYGDNKISDLYIVGNMVVGHKSTEKGVSQETDPSGSRVLLNGKDISTYTQSATERTWRGNKIIRQRQITINSWNISAMIHTHEPGNDMYSISPGNMLKGETYGGDFGLAVSGFSVYLVPTTSNFAYYMFRLDLSPTDADLYFPRGVRQGQEYMSEKQKIIFIK